MTRKVETLRLSGLRDAEAVQAVSGLLGDRSVADLSRLMVLDDTAALPGHAAAFEHLLTSRRLNRLLCVAIGPPAGGSRVLRVPGNISAGQGSAVIWVSDPLGVDWQLAASAVALVRADGAQSGLHHLVQVLSAAEVFDRVCEIAALVPGGVASPGLRLAGADAEGGSFTAALASAIRQLTGSQPGAPAGHEDPFTALRGDHPRAASLAGDGELSRSRDRVTATATDAADALDELTGIGGLLGADRPAAQARAKVMAAGEALRGYRDLVGGLLEYAHAPGGLTERHLQRLSAAGLRPASAPAGPATGSGPGGSPVSRAVTDSIKVGDTLPRVAERLALAERQLRPLGSGSYLPEVDGLCPQSLVHRLAEPPPLPGPQPWLPLTGALAAALGALGGTTGFISGAVIAVAWAAVIALTVSRGMGALSAARGPLAANLLGALAGAAAGAGIGIALKPPGPVAIAGFVLGLVIVSVAAARSWRARATEWEQALSPGQAVRAADALAGLMAAVAAREWPADTATLDEVARARIAVEGVCHQLREYADGHGKDGAAGPQAPLAARLGDALSPALRDLVLTVFAARPAPGGTDGEGAFQLARAKTAELIGVWTGHAREHGPLSPPPFATPVDHGIAPVGDGELAAIIAAATHDPRAVMWQLCAPGDLGVLDVGGRPQVVPFAPRITRQALSGVLPVDTVWTSSGQCAGLLRLVPLRAGGVGPSWSADDQREPPR